MISYLQQQPNQQAIVDALRGTSASGGTQIPGAGSPLATAPAQTPQFSENGYANEGMMKAAGAAGKWAKDNYFTDNSAVGAIGPEAVKTGGQTPATTNGGFSGMSDDLMKQLSPAMAAIKGWF